jgi:hypothetical protein
MSAIQAVLHRHKYKLSPGMEALLFYLHSCYQKDIVSTPGVMEVVKFFFDHKIYSEATSHLYLMQLQEEKWVNLTVDKFNKRRKAVKMTAKAQKYVESIGRHWAS